MKLETRNERNVPGRRLERGYGDENQRNRVFAQPRK